VRPRGWGGDATAALTLSVPDRTSPWPAGFLHPAAGGLRCDDGKGGYGRLTLSGGVPPAGGCSVAAGDDCKPGCQYSAPLL
jgi:hypothetical protein